MKTNPRVISGKFWRRLAGSRPGLSTQSKSNLFSFDAYRFYLPVTCSWHQKSNSPILQFSNLKCYIKAKEPYKTPFFYGVLVLMHYFKDILSLFFFILKAFCSTLNSRIGELIFDVTNRAEILNWLSLWAEFWIIFHWLTA